MGSSSLAHGPPHSPGGEPAERDPQQLAIPLHAPQRRHHQESPPTTTTSSSSQHHGVRPPSSPAFDFGQHSAQGETAGSPNAPAASAPLNTAHHHTRRFKPVTRDVTCELIPITPAHLSDVLERETSSVLLIDVRPYTVYSFTHVRGAISICIPSTLLKRQTFGFRKIMDFVAQQDVETLDRASECSHIVFYDQDTTNCTPDSTLRRTASKFLDADPSLAPRLHWLQGGLSAVAQTAQHLVEAGEYLNSYNYHHQQQQHQQQHQQQQQRSEHGPNHKLQHGRAGSEDPLVIDEPPKLTLSSLKAAPRSPFSLLPVVTAVDSATIGSPIHTPSSNSITSRAHRPPLDDSSSIHVDGEIATRLREFPKWLVNAVKLTESGKNVLAEAFQRLQAAEMQRVATGTNAGRATSEPRSANLLSPLLRLASPRSTPSTPFSESSALSTRSSSSTNTSPMDTKAYSQRQRNQYKQLHSAALSSGQTGSGQTGSGQAGSGQTGSGQTSSGHSSTSTLAPPEGSTATLLPPTQEPFVIAAGDDPRKNRYSNIAPFGYNRVLVRGTEYLNASYICSHISPLQYIATQAPVPAAFGDFWWCVWEQHVPLIVMLTTLRTESGQVKGNKYWFDSNYDGLSVQLVSEHSEPLQSTDAAAAAAAGGTALPPTVRIVRLTHNHEVRDVVHIQYENWPDLGCPADPNDVLQLVELKKRIMSSVDNEKSYVVVHCSAGCGRTGTFCVIDTVTDYLSRLTLEEAQADPEDRIINVVSEFREQRIAMVQNQRQLLLCYQAVMLWYLKQLSS